jgi:hypothetical protein
MADKQPAAPTHRAYSVIRREGQDDFWLNIGLAFPHKDGGGFNVILQAFRSTARLSAGKSRTRRLTSRPRPQIKTREVVIANREGVNAFPFHPESRVTAALPFLENRTRPADRESPAHP